MGAPAEKLTPTEFPPLQKGEFLMRGLNFPVMGAWGSRHLLVGKRYDFGFEVSGVVERIISLPGGAVRAWIRETSDRGPGRLTAFLYFPSGTYGPEAE